MDTGAEKVWDARDFRDLNRAGKSVAFGIAPEAEVQVLHEDDGDVVEAQGGENFIDCHGQSGHLMNNAEALAYKLGSVISRHAVIRGSGDFIVKPIRGQFGESFAA